MKTINANTKKGRMYIHSYEVSKAYSLNDVYGTYSSDKARAERYCFNAMREENGIGFRIISANTFHFSAAWLVADGLRVETACNSYLIKY